MILPVIQYPSPILNFVSSPVREFDDKLRNLVNNLHETVIAEKGIGISAIQCGFVSQVMLVSDNGKDFITMINPEVSPTWSYEDQFKDKDPIYDEEWSYEGCLSYEGKEVKVKRPREVFAVWYDIGGGRVANTFSGLLGHCIAHEFDHLQGLGIWRFENEKGYY
jgi:peptide deformylase